MKPLTKKDLYTVINLRNQGLGIPEIEVLTGLSFNQVKNAFYNSDCLMSKKNLNWR